MQTIEIALTLTLHDCLSLYFTTDINDLALILSTFVTNRIKEKPNIGDILTTTLTHHHHHIMINYIRMREI